MRIKFKINQRTTCFFFLAILISYNSFGQVVFEQGYFIDNDDKKTTCLIKNYDWKNSPAKIEYRLNESSEVYSADISEIKEFKVSNIKYQRFTVQIDQSRNELNAISRTKEPEFLEETVFLRQIIEGVANLYAAGKYRRYFYNVNDSSVKQLIHKDYLVGDQVLTNNSYKAQLWEGLKCSCISVGDIENTRYDKKDLVKIFEKYNNCIEADFINYDKKNKNVSFNLGIRTGLRGASLSVKNSQNNSQNIDFGNKMSFSFGLEASLILPFNKNKWAVTFEPTYQYYKAEDPRPNYENSVDYQSIELPVGITYNIFFSQSSKIFLTFSVVVLDIPFNSSIGSLEVSTGQNLNAGFGYAFRNKYSLEVQYGSPRSLLGNYAFYKSNYQSVSVIFGYNFF